MAAVLIVDDDEVIRDVLYELFAQEHLCHTAITAEQALEFLELNRYDVAIIDISLPGMSGLELFGHILQRAPETPVIIITGINDQQYARNLMRMGVFDYIEKPFLLQEAEGKLAKAILYRERWLEAVRDSAERALKHGTDLMQERRVSVRHKAQRAARLRLVAMPPGVKLGAENSQSVGALIGHTRDISETGLGIVVPCVRGSDRDFYGVEGVREVTLSLPTGIVEVQATPVRYEWLTEDTPNKAYLIGMRIKGMGDEDRARFDGFLGALL
jgi:CheY-like chemotaxis protein